MRKILQVIMMILVVSTASGQFLPRVGQPFQLAPSYNPAFSGIESFGDLKVAYRYQWTAYRDAPRYGYLSFNGRLKKPLDLKDQALRLSKQGLTELETNMPKSKRMIIGWGAQVFSETFGPISHTGGQVNLSLHYPLSQNVYLAGGISAVLDNTEITLSKITLADDNDPFYDFLLSNGSSYMDLNVRGGVVLYGKRFYLGGSYLPIMNSTIRESGINHDSEFYKATFAGGLSFGNGEIIVKPSVFGTLDGLSNVNLDYSTKMFMRDKLWWGITYRDVKSLIVLVGVNVNTALSFSYSYERSLAGFNQFNGGSHDLVVGLRLWNYRKGDPFLW